MSFLLAQNKRIGKRALSCLQTTISRKSCQFQAAQCRRVSFFESDWKLCYKFYFWSCITFDHHRFQIDFYHSSYRYINPRAWDSNCLNLLNFDKEHKNNRPQSNHFVVIVENRSICKKTNYFVSLRLNVQVWFFTEFRG